MEDVVNAGHSVTDGLRIADVTDVKLDLLGILRMLGLKLMAHVILLFFVTREDTDFLQVRVQEVLQNGRTKRTSTTSDHKGCIVKIRHFYFLLKYCFSIFLSFWVNSYSSSNSIYFEAITPHLETS